MQAFGALWIGKQQADANIINTIGKFAALPPAIEQRCHATCHQYSHIKDNPAGRVTRGDADTVTALDAVAADQCVRDLACGSVDVCKAQSFGTIDEKCLVAVKRTEMRKIVRKRGRRCRDYWYADAVHVGCHDRHHAVRRRQ